MSDLRVFTIPAGVSFADSLAAKLLRDYGDSPEKLTDLLILLPTRRACRMVRDAFLRQSGGRAILLPRLQPLGDLDEDALMLDIAASGQGLDIPPAIPAMERRVILTNLILARDPGQFPDQAIALADALAKLLDRVRTEGLEMSALTGLVQVEGLAERWQETLRFLDILLENWPKILAERGMIDAAARRNLLLDALSRHWAAHPPHHPVIAAGSTGSIPAVRRLLRVVAELPDGCVVLPGLDRDIDPASWAALDDTHPLGTLKILLHDFGLTPGNVPFWDDEIAAPKRLSLAREMMRPAATSDHWRQIKPDMIAPALTGLERIDCANAEEEAALIALIFRSIQHQPGQTATLITADRGLARRVAGACARYDLTVDDSAGQFLHTTRVGGFLVFCAQAALDDLAPVPLLALLKHRDSALGLPPADYRAAVRRLDLVLRGVRPGPGMAGLRRACADVPALMPLLDGIEAGLAPLLDLGAGGGGTRPFADFVRAHLHTAERVAASTEQSGASRLWGGEDGEAAADFFAELLHYAGGLPDMDGAGYLRVLTQLMRGVQVRTLYGAHPRLSIVGPLEARMTGADLVILGGMNEGVWPGPAEDDPWMSRPMRRDMGLPSPERPVGLSAHDFTLGFCAPRVIITRAARAGSAPTIPSRWLQRLDTVLLAAGLSLHSGEWLDRLRARERPARVTPAPRPAPTPPVETRPQSLSVTGVEQWVRDPYGVYARHVLKLKQLEIIDKSIDAADRGTILHSVLEDFIRTQPDPLPGDAYDRLVAMGTARLEAEIGDVRARHFWGVRLQKMAEWFVSNEIEWRTLAAPDGLEVKGEMTIPGTGFTLTAKADRIDRMRDRSGHAIIDYKTGAVPRAADIALGLSPQLPLEAGMLEAGAFATIGPSRAVSLSHWLINGGGEGGKATPVKTDDPAALGRAALEGLAGLVRRFNDPATPYFSLPRPAVAPRYNDYAHLARVQEWAVIDDAEGEE